MHIKPNADEENYDQYLETYKLQELIKKYSDYIRYPIVMEVEDYRQKEKPADAGEDYKPEWETVKEWKTLNSMVPLWQRDVYKRQPPRCPPGWQCPPCPRTHPPPRPCGPCSAGGRCV